MTWASIKRFGRYSNAVPIDSVEALCYEMAKDYGALSLGFEGTVFTVRSRDGEAHFELVKSAIREVDSGPEPVVTISRPDHWSRTFAWAAALGVGLDLDVLDLERRVRGSIIVRNIARGMLPRHKAAFKNLKGQDPDLRPLSVGVTRATIPEGKIGLHEGPKDGVSYSLLSVHPSALTSPEYLRTVVKHELIHYVLGETKQETPHDDNFDAVAEDVGLPTDQRR